MEDNLYKQVCDQLYINRFCVIDQWKNITLSNEKAEIKAMAMINSKGFVHICKIEKIKNTIKLYAFHFNKNQILIYDGFNYIFENSGMYSEILEMLNNENI